MGFLADFMQRKQIDSEAKTLAVQFAKRLPKERSGDAKRVAAEIQILLGHAKGFQRRSSLGLYGKSRLANTFQWTLIENGYDKALASEISREIASRLSISKSKPEPSR